jgi:uncharacterized membrane protein YqjE
MSRRALLRHLWSMVQTRTEAAGLVLSLQRSALGRGLAWYAIAAMAAMALMITLLLLVALGTPEEYRAWALGLLALALAAAAGYSAVHAKQQLTRDTALIADFTTGLRLDLAMVNLALKDPDTDDEEKLAARERAKTAVREAAVDKAATPSAADGADPEAGAEGPSLQSAAAAMRAAAPTAGPTVATEMDTRPSSVIPPEEMTTPPPQATAPNQERPSHGAP